MTERRPGIEALYHYYCEFDAIKLLHHFNKGADRKSDPDAVTNFLGVRVPVKVFPPILEPMKGSLEGLPIPGNWHADIAEWASALRSVTAARGTFRIVELGCGWACWLVNMGAAARSQGLDVDLIGIEGDRNHLANAADVLALNGFTKDQFRLVHGIAGPKKGKALFPDPQAGQAAWGGEAIFYPDKATLKRAEKDDTVQVLDCYPLETLSDGQMIDLLHIDIQGAELEYAKGNMDSLNKYVRRVLIGTHSRVIEGALQQVFLDAGWLLEMDRPVVANIKHGRPITGIDGVQLWVNPKLV